MATVVSAAEVVESRSTGAPALTLGTMGGEARDAHEGTLPKFFG